jgi:hypothetical protein
LQGFRPQGAADVDVICGVAIDVAGDVGATEASVLVCPVVMVVTGVDGSDTTAVLLSALRATPNAAMATTALPPITVARSFTRGGLSGLEFTSVTPFRSLVLQRESASLHAFDALG